MCVLHMLKFNRIAAPIWGRSNTCINVLPAAVYRVFITQSTFMSVIYVAQWCLFIRSDLMVNVHILKRVFISLRTS